jgi:hypothetical protein
MANDFELVRDLINFLTNLSEDEFLEVMYGEFACR